MRLNSFSSVQRRAVTGNGVEMSFATILGGIGPSPTSAASKSFGLSTRSRATCLNARKRFRGMRRVGAR